MNRDAQKIRELSQGLGEVLAGQREQALESLRASQCLLARLREGTADPRLNRLDRQLEELGERLETLEKLARESFLAPIESLASDLERGQDGPLASLMERLVVAWDSSGERMVDALLDGLLAETRAERGFLLFYRPDSTEAVVAAAREFATVHLSLEEYRFSRSLLRRVLESGNPLRLDDASASAEYGRQASVRRLELRSVLVVPLRSRGGVVGAIYLENSREPGAFAKSDLDLVSRAADLALRLLQLSGVPPFPQDHTAAVFLDDRRAPTRIIGQDPKIVEVLDLVGRVADSPATVLILGESGTGKELVARALHETSGRRERPFVVVNSAAIPENLLESELFGHERGAFTGAVSRQIGRLEQADGGTVFLDEIGELALPMQAKLLRFLQSGEVDRLGSSQARRVDVRVVAATSRDLRQLVEDGGFHSALFYRLNVVPVRLPPLRERRDDIPLLTAHFLRRFCESYGRSLRLHPAAAAWLRRHPFPGNVRELENLIHRLVALARTEEVGVGDLPSELLEVGSDRIDLEEDTFELLATPPIDLEDLQRRRQKVQRLLAEQASQLARQVVETAHGNITEAARDLGVHRVTLHRMLKTCDDPREPVVD